jgi:ABC-2 type transport system ATP-binding protein
MDTIIRVEGLTKRYGTFTAVNDISLAVERGEIYGFIGLNGSGKTTTIRALLGLIRPTSGTTYLHGKRVHAENHNLWKEVGCLVETPYAYPAFTVKENLSMICCLRRLPGKKSVDEIMERLRLTPYWNTKVRDLSLGNAQKLGLAKALIHNPAILILDEPANGLDPAGIFEIRELLRELAHNHGVTVFISSHILDEMARMTTRIGILHQGKLIQEIRTKELEKIRLKRLCIKSRDMETAKTMLLEKGYLVRLSGQGSMEITDDEAVQNPDIINKLLSDADLPLTMLKVEEESLESFFLRIIGINGGK